MDTRILLSALQEVEKRAERVSEDDVLATYVNIESLSAKDNGIVSGRRGTGNTRAIGPGMIRSWPPSLSS